MAKFHMTEDGPKLCTAEIKECRYTKAGGKHYEDFTRARTVYEASQKNNLTVSLQGIQKSTIHPKIKGLMDSMNIDEARAMKVAEAMGFDLNAKPKPPKPPTLTKMKTIARNILQENIEILNHSDDEDYVTINELTDPVKAGNNCFSVTTVVEEMLSNDHVDNESVEIVMDDGSVHWANKVGNNILDFSYRQFDENSEFPVVMKYDEWHERLNNDVHKKFGLKIAE